MSRELLTTPEIFNNLRELVPLAIALLGMALSSYERRSIAEERDGNKCHAPFKHKCSEKKGVQVHHITPQRYAEFVGLDEDTYDVPENLISICENAHRMIHPDMDTAIAQYHHMKKKGINSFKNMAAWRDEKLRNKQIYWNDEWDRQMRVVAMKLTQEARKRGWQFKMSKKRKKRIKERQQLAVD